MDPNDPGCRRSGNTPGKELLELLFANNLELGVRRRIEIRAAAWKAIYHTGIRSS